MAGNPTEATDHRNIMLTYKTGKTGNTWDTRSWLLGLFLGNFAGLLLLCGGYPPPRQFLETAFPYSAFGYYTGDLLQLLGFVCGGLIFPAILTSIAKKHYYLCGLLPLFLLMLWIIAGDLVSLCGMSLRDNLLALSGHFLALLYGAGMCWVVAALPIAVFRPAWQRRRAASGTLAPAAATPQVKWSVSVALLVPVIALVLLGWYNCRHPIHMSVTMRTHWPAGGEVEQPLVKHGTSLFVQVQLNGQDVLCRVDTGAEDVEWPRGLHIEGKRTRWNDQSCDILGKCIDTHTIVLPHVKIGGYEIENLPTDMSDVESGLFSPPPGPANDVPILGNPAFVQTVLTIDYKNSIMTIRPPKYDFTQQQRKPGDRILDIGWTSHYAVNNWRRGLYGTPSIQAVINGFTCWCTLDTGAGGSEICLTKKLVEKHFSLNKAKRSLASLDGANSSSQVPRLEKLMVSFPCTALPYAKPIALKLDGLVTPSLDTDASDGGAVIGLPLMERYRITIDYPRGRVLLEPYAGDVPGQKQEKQRTVAKLAAL